MANQIINENWDDKRYYYDGNDLGLIYLQESSQFKVWAPTATKLNLVLYDDAGVYNKDGLVTDHTDGEEMPMERNDNGVWQIKISADLKGKYYMYKVEFADGKVNYSVDPYANAVSANGQRTAIIDLKDTDPEGFRSLKKPAMIEATDAIIYELHVRDFSIDENSGISDKNKGKFLAFTEEGTTNSSGDSTGIDHLKDLGVTHVHLLPTYDFQTVNELEVDKPDSTQAKYNWGYDPQNFNVPEGSYSTNPSDPATRITEFKQMVKSLHVNGIRVVLDVVYNHTYVTEGSNFNNIVPGYYFRSDDTGKFTNGSGTGNEVASERPMVRKYIKDSIRYWAEEYDVDGFRFDLMGLIDIETMIQIEKELHEEVDKNILIYGEPWQAGGSPLAESMQTLKGSQKDKNFAVFNDNFREAIKGGSDDATKGFATGELGKESNIAIGIRGAIDDFTNSPTESINYVTAHDNLNLWDKVIKTQGLESEEGWVYLANGILTGESTRYSNIEEAVEAATPHAVITEENVLDNEAVRRSLLSNAIVMTAQGIPFFHAGDEILRTKYGDHNSYRSPDAINKIRWNDKTTYREVHNYYKGLIELRKEHPALRMSRADLLEENLEILKQSDNLVAFQLKNNANGDKWNNIVVIYNGNTIAKNLSIANNSWKVVVNDQKAGTEVLDVINDGNVSIEALSVMVLYDETV